MDLYESEVWSIRLKALYRESEVLQPSKLTRTRVCTFNGKKYFVLDSDKLFFM